MDILLSGGAVITNPFMLVHSHRHQSVWRRPGHVQAKRMTLDRKVFEIHKFRSMKVDADKGRQGV